MLFSENPFLEDHIVRILSLKPDISASEIYAIINEQFMSCSQSSIYQALRKLMRDNIITKKGKLYCLRIGWIQKIHDFSAVLLKIYINQQKLLEFFPEDGKTLRLKFSNFFSLLIYWGQITVAISLLNKGGKIFEWIPYLYFDWITMDEENYFFENIRNKGIEYFIIVGNENEKNLDYVKNFSSLKSNVSFAESKFHDLMNSYFTLSDKFLITVEFTPKDTRLIDEYFKNYKTARMSFATLSKQFGSITMKIESNTRNYKNVRKTFYDFFGVAN